MVEYVKGDLFESGAEVLVNPVNCEGVAGRGLALQFKLRFPINFYVYRRICGVGSLFPGGVFWTTGSGGNPQYIANFATKGRWRGQSELKWIEAGLNSLIKWVEDYGAASIAVPPLGCGLEGLRWEDVRPLIAKFGKELPGVRVVVYEPM